MSHLTIEYKHYTPELNMDKCILSNENTVIIVFGIDMSFWSLKYVKLITDVVVKDHCVTGHF